MAGRGRADDLVQETLLRALQAWERVEPDSNPRAWMHAILRNTFVSELRRSQREVAFDGELCDRDRSHERVLAIDLERALAELPAVLRETLLAVDVEGLHYREAAARTQAPIGTIMSRLYRARRRVAHKLAA